GDDVRHRAAGLIRERAAVFDLQHRLADYRLDLLRRSRGALGEAANIGCNDGEAAPMLARARRFDGRIEREAIGLEGDIFDLADDALDLMRARFDRAHPRDEIVDDPTSLCRDR